MTADDVHTSLMRRARTLNRWLTLGAMAIGVVSAAVAFVLFCGFNAAFGNGGGMAGAKAFGGGAGVTIGGTLVSASLAAWWLGRRILVARLRAWTCAAAEANGMERTSFDYLVAMYAKDRRPGDDLDVDAR
jgi:hypothetical protein